MFLATLLVYFVVNFQTAMSQKRNVSHSSYERTLTKVRRHEERREDQIRILAKENHVRASVKNEERLDMKIYLRKLQDEEYERQMEDAYLKVWCRLSLNAFAF